MRVAYLTTFPPTECGVAEYVNYLVKAMLKVEQDVDITIIGDEATKERKEGRLRVVNGFVRGSSDYSKTLQTIRDLGPFDVLHVQHEYGLFPPRPQFLEFLKECRKYCRSVICTLHSVYHTKMGPELIGHQQAIVSLVDKVVIHSDLQEFELWIQGADLRRVERIPHGTHINPYVGKIKKEEFLEELGVEDFQGFLLVNPGFLRKDKGLDVLVRAIEIVRSRFDLKLVISGIEQGKHGIGVLDSIKIDGKIPDYVILIHRFLSREELEKMLAVADLVSLAHRDKREKYSVSGVLHLAFGSFKPIVGTRIPRLVELMELMPQVTVPPEDVGDLAKKLLFVLDNLKDFERIFKPVFEYARETSWERSAERHFLLYNSVLAKKRIFRNPFIVPFLILHQNIIKGRYHGKVLSKNC